MSSKYKNILLSPELLPEEAKQIKKLFKKEEKTDKDKLKDIKFVPVKKHGVAGEDSRLLFTSHISIFFTFARL